MRKRWIAVALVVLVGTAAVWAAFLSQSPAASESAPSPSGRLVVTPAELDWQSETGDSEQVEFTLSNSGRGQLTIHEVRTTCGCTVASPLDRYVLEPGEETVLRVQIQPPGIGSRETVMTLATDAAATPAVRVPIRLRGRRLSPPYVVVWPHEMRHTSVHGGDIEIPFVVLCLEGKDEPPWLTGFQAESPRISVTAPTVLNTNVLDETAVYREYELILKLAGAASDGAVMTDVLRPQTRTESVRPLPTIPIAISRQPAVRAIPSTLLVRREELADGAYRRRVPVVAAGEIEWQITRIDPSGAWVTAELVDGTDGGRFVEITIQAPPPKQQGASQAVVQVETTHPDCPRLSISVVVD